MAMSRREFVGSAVGAMVLRPSVVRLWPSPGQTVVLDLGESCSLRESVAGYALTLGASVLCADPASVPRCAALVVPAAVDLSAQTVRAIATCLRAGGRVMLELGAGFANERAFRAHRAVLRDAFAVDIDRPVSLWTEASARVPYVDFTWPIVTKIRDFSRVVPQWSGTMIATVNGLPVASMQKRGRGTLIVLGTPVGPALWVGDAEAKRWLEAAAGRTVGRADAPVNG